MEKGSSWGGNYSRFTFDETKRYMGMLKEQGKSILDDEFNIAQEILLTLMRRMWTDLAGNGSPNNGFKIVGTGANNDFTIKGGDGTAAGAGRLYLAGLPIVIPSDLTYLTQPIAATALTTPVGARTDEVYVDAWLDEANPTDDPGMVDPTLALETSRRLVLKWQVKVSEGGVTPAAYVSNNITHQTLHIATLSRTATAAISAGMVADVRSTVGATAFAKLADTNLWLQAQRGEVSALPATTGSVALDLALSNNWEGTLTGNVTLANPTNLVSGQSGVIRIVNGATPYTVAWGAYWKGANGVLPALTPTAGAVDILGYYVESATRILVSATGDVK